MQLNCMIVVGEVLRPTEQCHLVQEIQNMLHFENNWFGGLEPF